MSTKETLPVILSKSDLFDDVIILSIVIDYFTKSPTPWLADEDDIKYDFRGINQLGKCDPTFFSINVYVKLWYVVGERDSVKMTTTDGDKWLTYKKHDSDNDRRDSSWSRSLRRR